MGRPILEYRGTPTEVDARSSIVFGLASIVAFAVAVGLLLLSFASLMSYNRGVAQIFGGLVFAALAAVVVFGILAIRDGGRSRIMAICALAMSFFVAVAAVKFVPQLF